MDKNETNEIFQQAMSSDENLPARVKEEVLGTIDTLKTISEVIDLFVTKAMNTMIASIAEMETNHEKNNSEEVNH